MRWLAVAVMLVATACDPSAQPSPDVSPSPVESSAPELPAVVPEAPSLEAFTAQAVTSCRSALSAREAVPLRGDPLGETARPRDIRAAIRHFRSSADAWTTAAGEIFDFGLPDDDRGRQLVAALDVLALRSQQVAEALEVRDIPGAQAALAALDQALTEADAAARGIGLGPLLECATVPVPAAGRHRVVVTASDFAFRLEAVRRGPTRFVVRNRGAEDHQLFIVPLRRAGTLDDAVAADRRGERLGRFLAGEGAVSGVARPGERVTVDIDLARRPYGLLCFIASPDGTPHAFKGMAVELEVQ